MKKSDKTHPSASDDANPNGKDFFFFFFRVSLLPVLLLVKIFLVADKRNERKIKGVDGEESKSHIVRRSYPSFVISFV